MVYIENAVFRIFIIRFLSANRGLWLLKGSDFIDQEMDKWLTVLNRK